MAGVVLVVTPNVTSMAIPTLLESAPSKSDVGLDLVGVFSSNLRLVDKIQTLVYLSLKAMILSRVVPNTLE